MDIFNRAHLLVGDETMQNISSCKVIIFGVGGVGSWCVEALVRSGIGHMTLVDSDVVNVSNVNRQLMATTKTIGQVKVEALKERLLDINPDVDIVTRHEFYSAETADSFSLDEYDYVIDAIDSLENKMLLIQKACESKATFFSSMGAALKMNPTKVDVAEFWKVKGCPLAAALRRRFKKQHIFPKRKFKCVYSEELLKNEGKESVSNIDASPYPKAQTNGTLAHITGIFGFTLAGLVLQDIWEKRTLSDMNIRHD